MKSLPPEVLYTIENELPDPDVPDFAETENAINPFTKEWTFKVKKLLKKEKFFLAADLRGSEGVITTKGKVDSQESSRYFLTDAAESCKIFHNKEMRERVLSLKPSPAKLLTCIMYRLGRNKDRIRLDAEEYWTMMGVNKKTYYSALTALKRYDIVRLYRKNIYWINPEIIFNGNRLTKYPHNIQMD